MSVDWNWRDEEFFVDELLEEEGLDLFEANMFALSFQRERQRQLDIRRECELTWIRRGVWAFIFGLFWCLVYWKLG